jgi:membrane protease YdiL (CAAX protease family)
MVLSVVRNCEHKEERMMSKATMKNNDPSPAPPLFHKRMRWRLFFVLWTTSVVGMFLVLPYALAIIPARVSSKLPPLAILIPLEVGQGAIFLGLLTLAGLFFANRTGLAAPILEAWLDGENFWIRLKPILAPSVLVGTIGTLVILALEFLVFQPAIRHQSPAAAAALSLWNQPAAWKGLLASLFGGIDEEIELRLFALSLLLWLGSFILRKPDGRPRATACWIANILAALLFGLGHLPAYSLLAPLTSVIVVRAVVLNGLLGLAFGYLYWTRGLESAMLSHFSADLLLHVILAL